MYFELSLLIDYFVVSNGSVWQVILVLFLGNPAGSKNEAGFIGE